MADHRSVDSYYSGPIYRTLSGLFGLFLTGLGIYVVLFGVVDLPIRVTAGLLIALLGADAVWSAIRSKQCWLAKLSPLM